MEETRKPTRKPRASAATKPAARPVASKAKPTVRRAAAKPSPTAPGPSPVEREEMIRTAAYFRAQGRGFAVGYEWEDWLAAEAEVSAQLEPAVATKPGQAAARKKATAS